MIPLIFVALAFFGLAVCFFNVFVLLGEKFPDFVLLDWFMGGVTFTIALIFAAVWNKSAIQKAEQDGTTG